MAYDPGALRNALAAAVGDDPSLVADLRGAFIESARAAAGLMRRSPAEWRAGAWRLHGLAASFGAVDLMALAAEAADGAPGDRPCLSRIEQAIAGFAG